MYKGGYSSIGRTTVCGTVSSLFNSGYPPNYIKSQDSSTGRTLVSWTKNEISNISSGYI